MHFLYSAFVSKLFTSNNSLIFAFVFLGGAN